MRIVRLKNVPYIDPAAGSGFSSDPAPGPSANFLSAGLVAYNTTVGYFGQLFDAGPIYGVQLLRCLPTDLAAIQLNFPNPGERGNVYGRANDEAKADHYYTLCTGQVLPVPELDPKWWERCFGRAPKQTVMEVYPWRALEHQAIHRESTVTLALIEYPDFRDAVKEGQADIGIASWPSDAYSAAMALNSASASSKDVPGLTYVPCTGFNSFCLECAPQASDPATSSEQEVMYVVSIRQEVPSRGSGTGSSGASWTFYYPLPLGAVCSRDSNSSFNSQVVGMFGRLLPHGGYLHVRAWSYAAAVPALSAGAITLHLSKEKLADRGPATNGGQVGSIDGAGAYSEPLAAIVRPEYGPVNCRAWCWNADGANGATFSIRGLQNIGMAQAADKFQSGTGIMVSSTAAAGASGTAQSTSGAWHCAWITARATTGGLAVSELQGVLHTEGGE